MVQDIVEFLTKEIGKNDQLKSLLQPLQSGGIDGVNIEALTNLLGSNFAGVNVSQVTEALNSLDIASLLGDTQSKGFLSKLLGMFGRK